MLPVNEIFKAVHTVGAFTGTPSIFIRLQGCPVGCPWCNTKHAWAINDDTRTNFVDMVAKEELGQPEWAWVEAKWLVEYIVGSFEGNHVVITGGEPCQYDLTPLTNMLEGYGYTTQVETSGVLPVQVSAFTFVTVSPKIDQPGGLQVIEQNMIDADEITFAISSERDIAALQGLLNALKRPVGMVYLHPIRNTYQNARFCVQAATEAGWRVSLPAMFNGVSDG
jgi:7-carboxy-7-deazaguanine synthase